jgi:hypothetical protein
MFSLGAEMWAFAERREFTDVILDLGGYEYHCHRVVLASIPGYFRNLFHRGFSESRSERITIRANDPCLVFEHVLRFLYTSETSMVTPQNAIPIHALALYFHLPVLAEAAESMFASITDPSEALTTIVRIRSLILPPTLLGFLAQSFPTLSRHSVIYELPPHLIAQIVLSPSLRIHSDLKLVQFLSRCPFDDSTFKTLSNVVQWSFLREQDWNSVRCELFGISDHSKARIIEDQRRLSKEGPLEVQIVFDSRNPELLSRLMRYVPPVVRFFGMDTGLLTAPIEKYDLADRQVLRSGEEILLVMNSGSALYLADFEMTVASVYSVLVMTLELISLTNDRPDIRQYGRQNVSGKAVFKGPAEAWFGCQRVTIRFLLEEGQRFQLDSAKAQGFIYKL